MKLHITIYWKWQHDWLLFTPFIVTGNASASITHLFPFLQKI